MASLLCLIASAFSSAQRRARPSAPAGSTFWRCRRRSLSLIPPMSRPSRAAWSSNSGSIVVEGSGLSMRKRYIDGNKQATTISGRVSPAASRPVRSPSPARTAARPARRRAFRVSSGAVWKPCCIIAPARARATPARRKAGADVETAHAHGRLGETRLPVSRRRRRPGRRRRPPRTARRGRRRGRRDAPNSLASMAMLRTPSAVASAHMTSNPCGRASTTRRIFTTSSVTIDSRDCCPCACCSTSCGSSSAAG
jgi:hypothetical protein